MARRLPPVWRLPVPGSCCTTGGALSGDPLDEQAIAAVVATADRAFGRLDILVNKAGIGYLFGPPTDISAAHLDAVLGVNRRAPVLLTRDAARLMIRGGRGGRVINIASQAGKSGFAFAVAHSASKHGLIGLTRAAALELGPHGITVNAICPNHVPPALGPGRMRSWYARAASRSMTIWPRCAPASRWGAPARRMTPPPRRPFFVRPKLAM